MTLSTFKSTPKPSAFFVFSQRSEYYSNGEMENMEFTWIIVNYFIHILPLRELSIHVVGQFCLSLGHSCCIVVVGLWGEEHGLSSSRIFGRVVCDIDVRRHD